MVGSAVATIVWSSAARNIASMTPNRMVRTALWPSLARGGDGRLGSFMAAVGDQGKTEKPADSNRQAFRSFRDYQIEARAGRAKCPCGIARRPA